MFWCRAGLDSYGSGAPRALVKCSFPEALDSNRCG
jgi:hypothetical protein